MDELTMTIPAIKEKLILHRAAFQSDLNKATIALEELSSELDSLCDELLIRVSHPSVMSGVLGEVAAERLRQQFVKGHTPELDDAYVNGELTRAAACYSVGYLIKGIYLELHKSKSQKVERFHRWSLWPWPLKAWKVHMPRRMLIKAAALIVAEIERIDRAAKKDQMDSQSKRPYTGSSQTR